MHENLRNIGLYIGLLEGRIDELYTFIKVL